MMSTSDNTHNLDHYIINQSSDTSAVSQYNYPQFNDFDPNILIEQIIPNNDESVTKSWINNGIIQDRIFWIYFIVTLFFIIIGVGSIIISTDPYMLTIAIFWLLANIGLMITVYHTSLNWSPTDDENSLICVVDANSPCFEPNNRVWLFINVLFIALLIISILWAGELSNPDAGPLRTMSGILILLGGLILCVLATIRSRSYMMPFWVSLGYLIIWFGLTLYVVIN